MQLTALDWAGLLILTAAAAGCAVQFQRWRRRVAARVDRLVRPPAAPQDVPLLTSSGGAPRALLAAAEHVVAAESSRRAAQHLELERLTEALSAAPQGVVVCDEHGIVRYRNEAGSVFSGARHGEALAERAVTELLAAALDSRPAEQYLELYGPPRRTLLISARALRRRSDGGAGPHIVGPS